jgi:hypothetical protein
MYFASTLTVDPSQLTTLRRKPTRGFRRLAEIITANALATKEEHESFTAFSILQDFNRIFRSIGVTDIAKITLDSIVLYEDPSGDSQDDFERAIAAAKDRISDAHQARFQDLCLWLEHQLPNLTVVLRVTIERIHRPGVYPIRIEINGLDSELQEAAENDSLLEDKMNTLFASQESYDSFVVKRKEEFEGFIDRVEKAIQQTIRVDHILRKVTTNVVRAEPRPPLLSKKKNTPNSEPPVFEQYHSTSSSTNDLAYLWMWSNYMHSHNTHVQNVTMVDEQGSPCATVSEMGLQAGENDLFNPNVPLEACDFSSMPELSRTNAEITAADAGESNSIFSWLDGFSLGDDSQSHNHNFDTGDSGSDGGFDGGSSCGSSCGSGCGGGD